MKIEKLYNDEARTIFLARLKAGISGDQLPSDTYMAANYTERVSQLQSSLADGVNQERDAYMERRRKVALRDERVEKLTRYIRDFWNVLQRRNQRMGLSDILLEYYRLPSTLPTTRDPHIWVLTANKLLNGELKAVEEGAPPMANPDAGELSECLKGAEEACNEVSIADGAHAVAQKHLANIRLDIDRLVRNAAASLRILLDGDDAPKRRRIMRTYGFTFTNDAVDDAEPVEDVETEPTRAEAPSPALVEEVAS